MPDDLYRRDTEQERNLRRLGATVLVSLLVGVGFICWWLYEGPGYFQNEMSYSWSYGPRKGPRVPLPAGTVPRDGAGYDALESTTPLLIGPATAAAMIAPDGVGHPERKSLEPHAAALGAALYANECGFCHGADGRGNTYVGEEYTPRPPDLHAALARLNDAAALSAISDGMTTPEIDTTPAIGPDWHAFRLYLDLAERQSILAYLRTAFPPGPAQTGPAPVLGGH